MNRLVLLTVFFLVLIWFSKLHPLYAEETLTFPKAFDLAKQHNLEIQAIKKEVNAAEGEVIQAGLIPNPALELGQKSTPFPGFTEGERSLMVSQEFELGGKRRARLSVAKQALEFAKLNAANSRRQLRQQVRTQFFQAWVAQERVKVLQEVLQTQEKFLMLNEQGFIEGQFPGIEVKLIKAETLRVEQKLDEAQSESQALLVSLAPLLGLSPNEMPPLEERSSDLPPIPDLNSLLARAEEKRPDLKAQQIAAEKARQQIALEKTLAFPNLNVGAGIVWDKLFIGRDEISPPIISSIQHQDQLFQVRFTLPLPLFNRNQGNITKANRLYESARLREQNLRKIIQSEVISAWQRVMAQKRINERFKQELLPMVKSNLETIEKGYLIGGESILAIIQARRTFLETQLDYLDNLRILHESIALLESSVRGEWP